MNDFVKIYDLNNIEIIINLNKIVAIKAVDDDYTILDDNDSPMVYFRLFLTDDLCFRINLKAYQKIIENIRIFK